MLSPESRPGSWQAYGDESARGSTYLLAIAIVDVADLAQARRRLRAQLLPRQRRLHFVDERPDRRRQLLAVYGQAATQVLIYSAPFTRKTEQQVRNLLLTAATVDLQDLGCQRLVIESREGRDDRDRQALRRAVRGNPPLTYEHLRPFEEPLLWLPDGFAWAYGKGGAWPALIGCPITHQPLS